MADIDFTNPLSIIVVFFVSIFSVLIIIVKFALAPLFIPFIIGMMFKIMFLEK